MNNSQSAPAQESINQPTPGPWHTGGTFNPNTKEATQWVWGPTPAGMQSGKVICTDATPADARLISAAPDLLDALKEATHWLRGRGRTAEQDGAECETLHEAEEMIFAAIAKATGVQPLNNGDAK